MVTAAAAATTAAATIVQKRRPLAREREMAGGEEQIR